MPLSTENGVARREICTMSVLVVTTTTTAAAVVITSMKKGEFSSTRYLFFTAKSSKPSQLGLQRC